MSYKKIAFAFAFRFPRTTRKAPKNNPIFYPSVSQPLKLSIYESLNLSNSQYMNHSNPRFNPRFSLCWNPNTFKPLFSLVGVNSKIVTHQTYKRYIFIIANTQQTKPKITIVLYMDPWTEPKKPENQKSLFTIRTSLFTVRTSLFTDRFFSRLLFFDFSSDFRCKGNL